MKSKLITVLDHGKVYTALFFVCPGCATLGHTGLHLLPVNTTNKTPSWDWDGNLEAPTISPSILTAKDDDAMRCHSFLRNGIFEFLGDCAHKFANQKVPMPDLYDWVLS